MVNTHRYTTFKLLFLTLLSLCHSLIIPRHREFHGLVSSHGHVDLLNKTISDPIILKRDGSPTDFSWIKKWAAVGDSFTAGIGSGNPLGNIFSDAASWTCSRYDRSYVSVLNRAFGSSVEDFQYVACSGARTGGIYDQVQEMDGDLDVVIMTAGGNDLCLAGMIKTCVLTGATDDECEAVIEVAQNNLESILPDNIRQVLWALNDKMKDDGTGIVIYNGYAQFFNTDDDDDCGGQDWSLAPDYLGTGLPLTLARRETFNNMVIQINSVIKSAVDEIASNSSINYHIGYASWDPWVYTGVSGQFCDPSSSGFYPDSAQPNLQFFKPTTRTEDTTELKKNKRKNTPTESLLSKRRIYTSSLMNTPNPAAVALHRLDPRAPAPPTCPGDDGWQSLLPDSFGLPDDVGKFFHPNELGHITIASFAAAELMDVRAQVLGITAPECKKVDEFTCWQKTGRRAYASVDRMNTNYKTFCNKDMQVVWRGGIGWIGSATYHKGTPDEHVFAVQLGEDAVAAGTDSLRAECLESMSTIINSCDGNDPTNPMDWKFGGQWVRGDNTWEVTAMADQRPWPPIQTTTGSCVGWYHILYSSYEIYGAGFSTYDYGQQTLLPAINDCHGTATEWTFKYLDSSDDGYEKGYEWKATFNDLIWLRGRCFSNNKVVEAAGGFTHGCSGND